MSRCASRALSPLPLIFSYKSEKSLRGAGAAALQHVAQRHAPPALSRRGWGGDHAHFLSCHSFSHTNLKSPCVEQVIAMNRFRSRDYGSGPSSAKPKTDLEVVPEPALGPEPELEQLQPEPEPEAELQPQPEPEPEAELQPELQPEPEAELQPELQPEPEPEAELLLGPKPTLALDLEPEPTMALVLAPAPSPAPDRAQQPVFRAPSVLKVPRSPGASPRALAEPPPRSPSSAGGAMHRTGSFNNLGATGHSTSHWARLLLGSRFFTKQNLMCPS